MSGTFFTQATGINDSGQVVGEAVPSSTANTHAFQTAPNSPINPAADDLGTLGGPFSFAYGINGSGRAIGVSGDITSGHVHAFRTAPNKPINPATDNLGDLGGTYSEAFAINSLGQVVGDANLVGAATEHAFRTAPNSPINPATDDLGTLGGSLSRAFGINDSGQVVGGADTTGDAAGHAFRTAPNSPINPATDDLGTLGGLSSAYGINKAGDVVGFSYLADNGTLHPFVYTGGVMTDLNSLLPANSGWVLEDATAINNAGQIVGSGIHNGVAHAYRLDPIITGPCTFSLSPTGQSFSASGGLGFFTVNTGATCGWTAIPSAAWIIELPSPSKGTGAVKYAIASNSGGPRVGSISVGGQTYNITQAGLTCSYTIGPTSASPDDIGGNISVSVGAPSGCSWTAVSNASWLTVKSGASGSGGGVVVLNVAHNTGVPRSGTATIAGQTFSVTQGAGACGALDVTSQTTVTGTGLTPIPFSTYLYSGSITVGSSADIFGPVYLVLIGEPTHYGYPNDSGLFGGGATTSCFSSPGYLILVSGTDLVPGRPVGIPLVWFTQSLTGFPRYSIKVLSGTPSH